MLLPLFLLASASKPPSCCEGMNILSRDPAFIALHEAPVQMDFTPKYGHMGEVAGANDFLVPPDKGRHVAIILFHEWWGLNNQIKATAEKLHESTGDGVVAIDLYGGKVTDQPSEAGAMMRDVDKDKTETLVKQTLAAMEDGTALGVKIRKIGTLGYCMGGGWSLQTALTGDPHIRACVMYYGYPELDAGRLDSLHAPLLGFFGNQDTGITPALVEQFKGVLKQDGKSYKIFSYDAPHAFANPSNPHFNKEATEDSWKKTVAFYNRNL